MEALVLNGGFLGLVAGMELLIAAAVLGAGAGGGRHALLLLAWVALALLQEADLVTLGESFAALDPETRQRCLRCVLKQAATVLVIVHP